MRLLKYTKETTTTKGRVYQFYPVDKIISITPRWEDTMHNGKMLMRITIHIKDYGEITVMTKEYDGKKRDEVDNSITLANEKTEAIAKAVANDRISIIDISKILENGVQDEI